jgi:radical SAM superfamily enzyme YgiQ (UPF0313 family)
VRAPGDIVLVSLYELGHPPLAIASAAAFLEEAGYAPSCVDLAVQELDAEVEARLASARLVALSLPMHTALRLGVTLVRRLRARGGAAHVACFGLYATLNAEHLRASGVDSVWGPDAEEELVALAAALERGAPAPAARAPRRLVYRLPSRGGLPPLARYAKLVGADGVERLAGAVEATRGCKHLCRHCPIPAVYGGRFFAVPVDTVLADAEQQVRAGARHITFIDADFLNGPRHAVAVARALHERFPEVTFDATCKVEHLRRHAALLPELARCGCVFIVTAVESLSDEVLAILQKGHGRADVLPVLEAVRAAGISLRPTFLPFTPWTTARDYLELVHFVLEHDLTSEVDAVQLTLRLLLPAGSLLLERPELAPHLRGFDAEAATHRWVHPDPRMDALQLELAALAEAGADIAELHGAAARRLGAGPVRALPPRAGRATARLSEPWFC